MDGVTASLEPLRSRGRQNAWARRGRWPASTTTFHYYRQTTSRVDQLPTITSHAETTGQHVTMSLLLSPSPSPCPGHCWLPRSPRLARSPALCKRLRSSRSRTINATPSLRRKANDVASSCRNAPRSCVVMKIPENPCKSPARLSYHPPCRCTQSIDRLGVFFEQRAWLVICEAALRG